VKAGLKELMKNWNLDKKCVGVGCYGQVFLATNTQDPTVHVAVKILNKSKMSLTEQQAVKREVGILQTLDHPNIVDYLETYSDSRFFYLIMENCPGGELIDDASMKGEIKSQREFTEQESASVMYDLLTAINHAHSQDIAHRDIKPANIMWGDDGKVRLCDFGLALQGGR
jgi:calcium-dependent protein kinase